MIHDKNNTPLSQKVVAAMSDLISKAQSSSHVRATEENLGKEDPKNLTPFILKKWQHFLKIWVRSRTAITSAWLHNTVKDCPPTFLEEIAVLFGNDVTLIVAQLTDNKFLSKAEKKLKKIWRVKEE